MRFKNTLAIILTLRYVARMAHRQPLPMPIHVVMDHKPFILAPGAVHRAAVMAACAYWHAGCPQETVEAATVASLAKLASGQWSALKAPTMAALAELLPELRRRHQIAHARRENFYHQLSKASAKGKKLTVRVLDPVKNTPRRTRIPSTMHARDLPPARATEPPVEAGLMRDVA